MKAIVLTCDRYRAITEHMLLKYEELWPQHPFTFRIPFQKNAGENSARTEFIKTKGEKPSEIPDMILALLEDLDDEEVVYWCPDDKYPIRLVLDKVEQLMRFAQTDARVGGLLFCRTRFLLDKPEVALLPNDLTTDGGITLLERKGWYQIWIHQFLRVKVLRHFFSAMPRQITSAKSMDPLKDAMPKPATLRLFVTKENFAVFGESTRRGVITQNCLESIRKTSIDLPAWFQQSTGEAVTVGTLPADRSDGFSGRMRRLFSR